MSTTRYGIVRASLWNGSKKWKATRGDDDARLMYFYLLTCPHRTSVGCYILPTEYAAIDLDWTEDRISDALSSLVAVDLISWDLNEDVVRIVDAIEKDGPKNPSAAKGMLDAALALPDCREKAECLSALANHRHAMKVAAIQDAITSWWDYHFDLTVDLPGPPVHRADTVSRQSQDADRTVARCADTSSALTVPFQTESQAESDPIRSVADRRSVTLKDGHDVWEFYQDTLTSEGHATRPTPPGPTDIAVAAKWIEGGATPDMIGNAFRYGIQQVAERQGQPPSRLKYFDGMIREAIEIGKSAVPAARTATADNTLTDEQRHEARRANYLAMIAAGKEGYWDPSWGETPDADAG